MSFQLARIVLYGSAGRIRELSFKRGRMNIVTGASKTGKSAIAEIVDYCLGSGQCSIPAGVIRESVVWYGLVLWCRDGEAFVARKGPAPGANSSSEAYYLKTRKIRVPKTHPESNMNLETLRATLSREVGIRENVHEVPEGQTRPQLSATIRHALIYCLQQQDEIASKKFLFHKQGEPFVPQAIKDTAPYFLGAVEDGHVLLRQRLRGVQDELRKRLRELQEAERIVGEGFGQANTLINECQSVGLLEPGIDVSSMAAAIDLLRVVAEKPTGAIVLPDSDKRTVDTLLVEREKLTSEYRKIHDQLESARDFANVEGGASRELIEQRSRLRTLELIPVVSEQDHAICPICETSLAGRIPLVSELTESLRVLDSQLSGLDRETERTKSLVRSLEAEEEKAKMRLNENTAAIRAVQSSSARLREARDDAARQSLVVGRVTLYLEHVPKAHETSGLREEIAELERRARELEEKLSSEVVEEKVGSILAILGARMAKWAKRLQLEHSQYPLRIDLRRLNVVADSENGPIPMDQMGSGENWVGYHLIAHLALHSWFVEESRPVPRFIFLDQPSQIYFPPEAERTESRKRPTESDWIAVTRMFKLLYETTLKLKKNLQIIVTDHADLNQAWFKRAVIARWREGEKLIPSGWDAAK